ncbi:hypothetical protein LSTR_LSTR011038 [Laodelphax striatellus]|uniref:Uncharacterized protein n=1 Tax=Laodelphax striatellus TaxID=195883 RepID=A0A482WHD2_LAOST|nr:hypothetical protein LSTR_LSTR011038 [Laodelphax striatellus]
MERYKGAKMLEKENIGASQKLPSIRSDSIRGSETDSARRPQTLQRTADSGARIVRIYLCDVAPSFTVKNQSSQLADLIITTE